MMETDETRILRGFFIRDWFLSIFDGIYSVMERGMNMNNKGLDYLALTVAIIGAINWGLIGFFSFDLVAFIFGNMSWLSRIIYAVVGIAGLYIITFYMYAGGAAKESQ